MKNYGLSLALMCVLAGCDVGPLTRDQLYGPRAGADAAVDTGGQPPPDATEMIDARTVAPDVAVDVASDERAPAVDTVERDLAPEPACMATNQTGFFSGGVYDDCNPALAIEAAVGIGGKHTCSFAGKGSFFFSGLPVGCNLTVMAAKPGYLPWQAAVVVPADGLASYTIRLQRVNGCTGPAPAPSMCQCEESGCVWR